MILSHRVQRETRLLSVLRRELGLSSTLVNRLKYRQAYRVNGQAVFTNFIVRPGDLVTVTLEEELPVYPAEDVPLSILFEDEALIALDKPPGMMVHPSSARNTGTLANALTFYYQSTGQASAVHPVSRLDRDTFGVVLLAKNAHIHAKMCAQSKAGGIEKVYRAAVWGGPGPETGLIDAPIARLSPTGMLRCVRADGKPARTAWRVLDRGQSRGQAVSLLELRALTGRTHQLRVHCAHMGWPILGDPQYAPEDCRARSAALGLEWQQLCAARLGFTHPMTEKFVEIWTKQSVSLDFFPGADV